MRHIFSVNDQCFQIFGGQRRSPVHRRRTDHGWHAFCFVGFSSTNSIEWRQCLCARPILSAAGHFLRSRATENLQKFVVYVVYIHSWQNFPFCFFCTGATKNIRALQHIRRELCMKAVFRM